MKVFFDMIGCRLNQAEIESMAMDTVRQGGEVVTDAKLADVIIINTCCVTAKAAAESRKMIRMYRRDTDAKVIVTGCWPSVNKLKAETLTLPEYVFTNATKDEIVNTFRSNPGQAVQSHELIVKPDLGMRNRTRAFVKVQDGCNNRCSYCLTQIARGPSRSVSAEKVIQEIQELARLGLNEIVLSGVQLGSWGKDLEGKLRLSDLVRKILAETNVRRIRLSSIEPWDINQDLLDCWNDQRMCPHLHIPLQSGADPILQLMSRPINTEKYLELIRTIRGKIPGMAITTDIIVGFPGETEALFQQTLDCLSLIGFSGGHVFKFSRMPGTSAYQMENQVTPHEKQRRSQMVHAIFKQALENHARSKLGLVEEVLWEDQLNSENDLIYTGLTRDYLHVFCKSNKPLRNTFTRVKLTSIDESGRLFGMDVV